MTITTISEQNYQKPGTGAIIGGVAAGAAVSIFPLKTMQPIVSNQCAKEMNKVSLSADEFVKIKNALANTMKKSGLETKGVEIIEASWKNNKEITKLISEELNSHSLVKYTASKKEIEETTRKMTGTLLSGKNAVYLFKSKKIIVPKKQKLVLATFHEAGHAMNANLSKIGKLLQKCRASFLLALPIALIALLKTQKAPGEEPKNGLDKTTTFIKNNAGKLAFATFLPMIIEEGLASIKGHKFAKQLLSPELAKKVAKINAIGFSSYMITATLTGLSIYLGTKVKDAIAKNKLVTESKETMQQKTT